MLLTFKKQFIGPVLQGLYSSEMELRTWLKNNNDKLLERVGETRLQELVEQHVEAFSRTAWVNRKATSIRAYRKKRSFRITDQLDMYSGARTRDMMNIGERPSGQWRLNEIEILEDRVLIDGHAMTEIQLDTICRKDGFRNMEEFRAFFRKEHGLPFLGQYLTWNEG